MKRKPYSIITPPYDTTSGGIRVMWGLYGWLLARGEEAYINLKISDRDFIAVYPEIYHGNPAGATTVARYILATPGSMMSYGNPSPTTEEIKSYGDHVFVFSKIYDTFGVDEDHLMFLPIINLNIFKVKNRKHRKKTCFLVGKGTNTHSHPPDSLELTREIAKDQEILADILNECHTLYCYDRLSAMMEIARLCGCRVVYLGNFSKEELQLYEPGLNGVTYGREHTVPLNALNFREHYRALVKKFGYQLDKFIEITQS